MDIFKVNERKNACVQRSKCRAPAVASDQSVRIPVPQAQVSRLQVVLLSSQTGDSCTIAGSVSDFLLGGMTGEAARWLPLRPWSSSVSRSK